MFDIPLFPSFDCLCRKSCPAPRPCNNSCRGDEYIIKICGVDACGNYIVSIRRR